MILTFTSEHIVSYYLNHILNIRIRRTVTSKFKLSNRNYFQLKQKCSDVLFFLVDLGTFSIFELFCNHVTNIIT